MARFVSAIAQGGAIDGTQVLTAASVDALTAVQVPDIDDDQGLLGYRWDLDGDTVSGHNGEETGTSTEVLYRHADGLVLVVLMNSLGRSRTLEHIELAMVDAAAGL